MWYSQILNWTWRVVTLDLQALTVPLTVASSCLVCSVGTFPFSVALWSFSAMNSKLLGGFRCSQVYGEMLMYESCVNPGSAAGWVLAGRGHLPIFGLH
ncbi:uncharacterized protein B0T23DRAFT_373967 [Neurospora hispaniola]|uniref:Uncharacterized protein n=1 Tax=Neurospora hispaniola TaxID=588809 RepID=A0AAJ0MTR8_9PEZI|nr:hypothetical protein B0T23DRAFT_373967 [Neurospora hispaniola]